MPRKPRTGHSKSLKEYPLGESDTELLHADEDVHSELGFQRSRPEFFNPSWQLKRPMSLSGDQDGADSKDLYFPPETGEPIPVRQDPSEAAANLMKEAGFLVVPEIKSKPVPEEMFAGPPQSPPLAVPATAPAPELEQGELPTLTLEVPSSETTEPSGPSGSPSPLGPLREAYDSPSAWASSPVDALQALQGLKATAMSFSRLRASLEVEEALYREGSVMSGDDLMNEPVHIDEPEEENPEDDEVAQEASQALRGMLSSKDESQDVEQRRLEEAVYKEKLRRVQRGVKSYMMLQNFNSSLWSDTFGYGKQERRFPDFWEQQEKRVQEAIENWPLNPARLEDMQKSDEVKDWVSVMMRILGLDEEASPGVLTITPSAPRVRKRWKGHLQVAGSFTKGGTEFFYIDMSKGPFCVFPEKAVVMEVWRDQRLVQVSAALVVNDWKEPRAGAFARMLPTSDAEPGHLVKTPQKGDQVVFPACQHFQRNFQDFIDGCLEADAPECRAAAAGESPG